MGLQHGSIGAPFLTCALHADAPVSVANKTHFNDPQFAELFLKALAEPDLAKRTPLVHAAQRIQYERGGLLVWGYANLLDGVSSRGGARREDPVPHLALRPVVAQGARLMRPLRWLTLRLGAGLLGC
jgi:hypothetical protein